MKVSYFFENYAKIILFTAVLGLIVLASITSYFYYLDNSISVNNPTITNITDSSFTLVWSSHKPYRGKVYIIENHKSWHKIAPQIGLHVFHDDRDINLNEEGGLILNGKSQKRYTHTVTVNDLKPESSYKIRIGRIIKGKELEGLQATTQQLNTSLSIPNPGYGKINGTATNDSVILFNAINRIFSTPISNTGTYTVDLNLMNTNTLHIHTTILNREERFPDIYLSTKYTKPFETININNDINNVSTKKELLQSVNAQEIECFSPDTRRGCLDRFGERGCDVPLEGQCTRKNAWDNCVYGAKCSSGKCIPDIQRIPSCSQSSPSSSNQSNNHVSNSNGSTIILRECGKPDIRPGCISRFGEEGCSKPLGGSCLKRDGWDNCVYGGKCSQ